MAVLSDIRADAPGLPAQQRVSAGYWSSVLRRLARDPIAMVAAAILAAAFGVAVFAAFGALARHTAGRWHPAAAAGRRRT